MGSLESKSFAYVSPEVSLEMFQEMKQKTNDSRNREVVANCIQRGAIEVVGESLVNEATNWMKAPKFSNSMREGHLRGIQVIKHKYVPSIIALAVAFELHEQHPELKLLSARLYQHEVGLVIDRQVSSNLPLHKMHTMMDAQIEEYKLGHKEAVRGDDLYDYIVLPPKARIPLSDDLRKRKLDVFFKKLHSIREDNSS